MIKRREFIAFMKFNDYDYVEASEVWEDLVAFVEDERRSEEEIKFCLQFKNAQAKERIRKRLKLDDKGQPPLS